MDSSIPPFALFLFPSGNQATEKPMPSRKVSRHKPPDFHSIPINIDLLSGSLLHSQFDSTFKKLSELFLSSLLLSGLTQNVCTAQKG